MQSRVLRLRAVFCPSTTVCDQLEALDRILGIVLDDQNVNRVFLLSSTGTLDDEERR